MEIGPTITPSYEAPASGPEKKDEKKSKKKSEGEVFRSLKQRKVEQDLSESLNKFSIFEKPADKSGTETLGNKPGITRDELAAPEAASETEAPEEGLSEAEARRVAQELAVGRLADLKQEAADGAVDDDTRQPAEDFLNRVADGQEVEAAFGEAVEEFGLSEDEVAEIATSEEPANELEIVDTSVDPNDEAEIWIDHSSRGQEPTPPPVNSGGSGHRGPRSGGVNQGAGGSLPPASHRVPFDNSPERSALEAREAVSTVNSDMVPIDTAKYYERRARSEGLLLGGLIGYLIGRRRGRIKTEKKLQPVRKRLENQVRSLDRDLAAKELVLRRLNVQKSPSSSPRSYERVMSQNIVRQQALKNERTPTPERTRLGLEKPARAERLGQLLVAAQTPEKNRSQRSENIRQAFRPEDIKTMRRRELLELSEKIRVEGASLRHIYESHLIGEKQLRHLVGEYLGGQDIRRDLRREMIEREIDFERDPLLRDRVRSQLTAGDAPLNQLLAKVGPLPGESRTDDHRQAAAAEQAARKADQQRRRRRLADTGMITIIVVLAVAVAILLVR